MGCCISSPLRARLRPDVGAHVEAVRPYIDAGVDEIALVHVGAGHQESFISWARDELLSALRSLEKRPEVVVTSIMARIVHVPSCRGAVLFARADRRRSLFGT